MARAEPVVTAHGPHAVAVPEGTTSFVLDSELPAVSLYLHSLGEVVVEVDGREHAHWGDGWLVSVAPRTVDLPPIDRPTPITVRAVESWAWFPYGAQVSELTVGSPAAIEAHASDDRLRLRGLTSDRWLDLMWFLVGAVHLWLWRSSGRRDVLWFALVSMAFPQWLWVQKALIAGPIWVFPGLLATLCILSTASFALFSLFFVEVLGPRNVWTLKRLPLLIAALLVAGLWFDPLFALGQLLVIGSLCGSTAYGLRRSSPDALPLLVPLVFALVGLSIQLGMFVELLSEGWRGVWSVLEPLIKLALPVSMLVVLVNRGARTQRAIDRFVPRAYLAAIGAEDLTAVRPGDRVRRTMTVFFSDIRGFTGLSERLGEERMAALVDRALTVQAEAIRAHGGFVDKYMGDGLMALFEDADDAVGAALAASEAVRGLQGDEPVQVGVGLHTGELLVGAIGSPDALSCTAMGDTVNVASRVEGLTKYLGASVLMTGETRAALTRSIVHEVDRLQVKGRQEPVVLFVPGPEEPGFTEALAAWRAGDAAAARAGFTAAAEHPVAAGFLQRLDGLQGGFPVDWDGTTQMQTK